MSLMGKKKRQADHSLAGDSSDSNGENEGKANAPSCLHLNKAILLSAVKKILKLEGLPHECCECKRGTAKVANGQSGTDDEDEGTLFICLRCGHCRCNGRLKHAENHSKNCQTDAHDIAVNPVDWMVWCFKCNQEIPTNSTKQLLECYEFIRKKGNRLTNNEEAQLSFENALLGAEPISYTGTFVLSCGPVASPTAEGHLPRVRGLANLGNTCFFNAVLQCLAQTPFLLPILDEMREAGEKFRLPGGEVQIGEEKETLEPLEGTLREWGPLTAALADTLRELQSGRSDVFVPKLLRQLLHVKCPQFAGYNEHDSHELLRQLLDTVRNEDHERYKQSILEELNLVKRSVREQISDQQRRAVKGYGRQAGELLLRPSQVFRGELVSTLQCQKCRHSTDHIEHFLDLSLPVVADKPVHVRRRVNSEDGDVISKHQLKKERKARKARRKSKYISNGPTVPGQEGCALSEGSDDQSDADNEDEAETEPRRAQDVIESGYSSEKIGNGDSVCGSPSADAQTHIQPTAISGADYSGQLNEDSILVKDYLGATGGRVDPSVKEHVNAGPIRDPDQPKDNPPPPRKPLVNLNLDKVDKPPLVIPLPPPPNISATVSPRPVIRLEGLDSGMCGLNVDGDGVGDTSGDSDVSGRLDGCEPPVDTPLDSEGQGDCAGALESPQDTRETSTLEEADSVEGIERTCTGSTLAPRVYTPSGDCTLITCLNQFTAQELLSGNNKVGCEACTERLHGKGGKTLYTDASKQLLILNPPAILILHLKRFQVLRFTSKKNSEDVSFPPVLDLAPFCSVKCRSSANVRKDQTEVRYALYGVVQHSGSMHGGHYVAHVKVRPSLSKDDPRWAFLPPGPSRTGSETAGSVPTQNCNSGPPDPPPGKWYFVSDSHVSESRESRVLASEAYLLFYERIW